MDDIIIAASDLFATQIAAFFQIGDDLLNRALRDANRDRYLA